MSKLGFTASINNMYPSQLALPTESMATIISCNENETIDSFLSNYSLPILWKDSVFDVDVDDYIGMEDSEWHSEELFSQFKIQSGHRLWPQSGSLLKLDCYGGGPRGMYESLKLENLRMRARGGNSTALLGFVGAGAFAGVAYNRTTASIRYFPKPRSAINRFIDYLSCFGTYGAGRNRLVNISSHGLSFLFTHGEAEIICIVNSTTNEQVISGIEGLVMIRNLFNEETNLIEPLNSEMQSQA